jgi:3-phenylpropionate/trans-cinnamate dioxygenase ferredoxin reductase subunit
VTARSHRLESIQNATDHANFVAARLTGETGSYHAVPWFWTDQYGHRLQIAGVASPGAVSVLRGTPDSGGFSVCRFEDTRLVAVDSVGRPADHIAARKLLSTASGAENVSKVHVADVSVPLKSLLPAAL